jgi:type IV pilus assembly protein PilE
MTVIAIMGILSAIAYASYSSAMTKAKRSEGKSALMKLMQQEERFYTQNNSYIVFSQASSDANEIKFNWFSGDSARKVLMKLRPLLVRRYHTKLRFIDGDTWYNEC